MRAGSGKVNSRRVEVKRYRGGFMIEVNSAPFDAMISVIGKYPELHGKVGLFTQKIASRGAYNEFGSFNKRTGNMNPFRPWMRNALKQHEQKYFNYLEQITKGIHGTVFRKPNVRVVRGIMKDLMSEVAIDFTNSIWSGVAPANSPFTLLKKAKAGKALMTLQEDREMGEAIEWRWSRRTRGKAK